MSYHQTPVGPDQTIETQKEKVRQNEKENGSKGKHKGKSRPAKLPKAKTVSRKKPPNKKKKYRNKALRLVASFVHTLFSNQVYCEEPPKPGLPDNSDKRGILK